MSGQRVILYGADERPLVADRNIGTSEVVRSVSFKLNLGNYQSMDFFCSQKAQCAADEADSVSVDLYDWCYEQVMASVKDVKEKQARKEAAMAKRSAA
jgi:hypothetical protein